MTRRVVLVLALSALIVSLQAQHVYEQLTGGPRSFVPVRVERDALVLELSAPPRGPATQALTRAGARDGDRIEAAYAGDGFGGAVSGMGMLLDVHRRAVASPPMRLILRRPSAGDGRIAIDVPSGPGPPARFLALNVAWTILLSTASLVAALLLGLLKPDDKRAFAGSLLFIAFAGVFTGDPQWLRAGQREVALATRILCGFAVDVLFLWFFLIFPTPSIIDKKMAWLKPVALVIACAGAAVMLTRQFALLTSLQVYDRLDAVLPRWIVGRPLDVLVTAFVLIGAVSLVLNTLRPQSRDDRRRMVIILTGTLLFLVPFVGIATYYSVTDRRPPFPIYVVLGMLAALFPLSFVYAVVRHRVLGIRLIVRRGTQYALVSAGFRVLLGGLVFVLFWYGIGPLLAPLGQGPVTSALVAAGAALLAARLLRNVRGRVMPAIDRRFFRDAYDARRVLTELSHSVRELALEPDRLALRLVDTISETLHPRTSAVLLQTVDPESGLASGPFRCVALRRDEGQPVEPGGIELPDDGVVVRRATPPDAGTPGVPMDVFMDESRAWAHQIAVDPAHGSERAALAALGVQLAVPLAVGPRLLGLVLLGEKRSEEPYSRDDKELLATVAEQTALALDYGQLARRAAREESLRKEVEIARNVQTRLFPQTRPPVRFLDYAGVCRPAREIGGDSYDFIALDSGRLGLSVGDISGKGVAAALLMANLQALVRSHATLPGRELKDQVRDVNRLLVASIPDNRFATFFYGVFDTGRRALTYVNAGHNPPMLLRPQAISAERLEPTGMMLGVFDEARFEQATVQIEPGDVLVVYSDGICDALNPTGDDYGDARLEAFVRAHAALPAGQLMDRILEDVTAFAQGVAPFDDMTLVVARMLDGVVATVSR